MTAITAENSSRFADTARGRIHYNEAGEGPVVIMLHGSGPGATGWSNFSPNIGPLAERYRIILMDFPGWGQSDALDSSGEHLLVALADAVKALMDTLGIDRAALVGNSLGGMAAQLFASLHADRITHLITMGAPAPAGPPQFFSPGGISEGLRTLFEAYHAPTLENFRRLVGIMVFDPAFITDRLVAQRREGAVANPQHLQNFPRNAGAMPSLNAPEIARLGDALAMIATPALIIHGRDDRVINVENSLRVAAIIPNSTLLVFNRCGHWAQLEHAAAFNRQVDAFIAAHG
ncbi:alpha/beta fold hydrolase [Sphingoaurantiacus capsulatus]|uniref:Alpha/beta fold hydrolase n=1 Tax=Sphingoaurantiacus capsulatus TaxID=1771310 RepID=A0ABV7X501_9SPHN